MLTNQVEIEKIEDSPTKCIPIDSEHSPVTVRGTFNANLVKQKNNSANARTPDQRLGSGGAFSDNVYSPSVRSKIILEFEAREIRSRVSALQSRLEDLGLSTQEKQRMREEIDRNLADLAGLRREIAKLE